MNTIDITKLSVTELKALAYDVLSEIEKQQNNLRAVNNELAKRHEKPSERKLQNVGSTEELKEEKKEK